MVYRGVCRMQGLHIASASLTSQLELLLSRRALLLRSLTVPVHLNSSRARVEPCSACYPSTYLSIYLSIYLSTLALATLRSAASSDAA